MTFDNFFSEDELSQDILPNKLILKQPLNGFRSGSDALLLSDFLSSHIATHKKNTHILDIGCGSGAIALSLLKKNPCIHATGLELQSSYSHLALKNSEINNLSDRFKSIQGDLNNIQQFMSPNIFDYVVTNPPFYHMGTGRPCHDTGKQIAHYGTLDLIEWIRKSLYPLKNNGILALICRTDRLDDIYRALDRRAGNVYIKPIITGNTHTVKRIIVTCQKGKKGGTTLAF